MVRERPKSMADLLPPSTPQIYAPPDQRPDTVTSALGPLPPYVTHATDVSRSAAIAAHAVVIDYEKAAQTVEEMGRNYHQQAQAVIQTVIDCAKLIRERGGEAFREIEMSSKIGGEVVGAINDLKTKMHLSDRLIEESTSVPEPPAESGRG
jgi:hypothetical protein